MAAGPWPAACWPCWHYFDRPTNSDRLVSIVGGFQGVEIGDYVDLFTHICGFYLHYADEKIPASALVRNWNVRMLQLPRETRHNDHSVMLDLFTHLDKFLAQRNCKLMY